MLKEKDCQPRILYLVNLTLKNEGEINTFTDKQSLREFVPSRPDLQEIKKESVLQAEMKMTLDSNSNLHKEIKCTGKANYISKFKRQYKPIFYLNSIFLLHDSKNNSLKP